MRKIMMVAIVLVAVAGAMSVTFGQAPASRVQLDKIKLPAGFHISMFAEGLRSARSMTQSPSGTIFVGSDRAGSVYALRDDNKDGKADKVITVVSGLDTPNGVAFRDGALYVAEVNRILRFDKIEPGLASSGPPVVVSDKFPSDKHHGWKFIRFGPDGLLYVPVGAPCNVCDRGDPYNTIWRMKPDGSGLEIFARGVRNTVGFDWHPTTHELWFTDNGRDNLGDDLPGDELNRAPKAGMHFGYPYCHQGTIVDPELGGKRQCSEFEAPAQRLLPHAAAIGMRFYTGSQFPQEYRNQVFIAEHGSWNRSPGVPYNGNRVSIARLDGTGKVVSYGAFAEGWLDNRARWGRPVDLEVLPDGSLLVSDDTNGVIYRISYGK
ncbi:MAG: sorbosone dehydrogenase family protein [Vicinamibacterales bacterium]|nr:sorbosone dehydrogenase family protein [Vicinamibacterales bacterium]